LWTGFWLVLLTSFWELSTNHNTKCILQIKTKCTWQFKVTLCSFFSLSTWSELTIHFKTLTVKMVVDQHLILENVSDRVYLGQINVMTLKILLHIYNNQY
jgi:hypothetical protein